MAAAARDAARDAAQDATRDAVKNDNGHGEPGATALAIADETVQETKPEQHEETALAQDMPLESATTLPEVTQDIQHIDVPQDALSTDAVTLDVWTAVDDTMALWRDGTANNAFSILESLGGFQIRSSPSSVASFSQSVFSIASLDDLEDEDEDDHVQGDGVQTGDFSGLCFSYRIRQLSSSSDLLDAPPPTPKSDIDFMEILRPAFVSTASQLADTASIPVVQSNADLHNVAVVLGSSDKTLVPLEYCRVSICNYDSDEDCESDGYCDSNEYEDRKSIYDNGDKDERGERGDLYNNDESDESFDNENTASTANSKDVYESYGIYGIYDSYCSFSRENNNDDDARLCDTPTKPPRGTFAAMQPADALMATDTG